MSDSFCPECGSKVPDGASACPNCGHAVKTTAQVNNKPVFCPQCGTTLPRGTQNCTNCGAKIQLSQQAQNPDDGDFSAKVQNFTEGAINGAKNFKKNLNFDISKANWPGLGAAFFFFFASFLPYISISFFGASESFSLFSLHDGFIYFVMSILIALFSFSPNGKKLLVCSGIMFILIILNAVGIFIFGGNAGEVMSFYSKSVGFYFSIIGELALVAAGVISFMKSQNKM